MANTLQGVGKEVRKLKGELNKLTPGTDDFVKKSAELKKHVIDIVKSKTR